mgnify:CR=1 FL=1
MEENKHARMLIEHGLIPGHTLSPNEPGMENSSSIIPEDLRMNPNCPCPTRTCPLHGFCDYCSQHHAELNRALGVLGLGEHCHFHHCKQDVLAERYGEEEARAMARKAGEDMVAAAKANREKEGRS